MRQFRGEVLRAAASSGSYVLADGLSRGVAFALTLVYTHYLLPGEFGLLALASTVSLLLIPILGLSLSLGVSRLWFEAESDEQRRELLGSALGFVLIVPTVLLVVIETLGRAGLLDVFPQAPYAPYLRYAVLTAYFGVFFDLALWVLVALRRPGTVLALAAGNSVLLLALSTILVIGLHEHALGVLRAGAAASGAAAVASVLILLRLSARSVRISRRWLAPSLVFALPLIADQLAQWLLQVSDRPVLSHYVAQSQLGDYYIGYSVGAAAGLVVHGVSRALIPTVTRDLKAQRIDRVVRMGTYWFGALVVVCLAVALFGRDLLATVAPPSYRAALPVVPIVAGAHVAFAAWSIVSRGIWFAMRTRAVPLLTFAAGAVNVGLNILLVPRYGIVAAAWNTVAGFSALALLNAVVARRLYRIDWEYVRWGKLLVAATAAYAFAQLAGTAPSIARLALELTGVFVIFPGALSALFFWTSHERTVLRGVTPTLRVRP